MKNRFIHLVLINLISLYGLYYSNIWLLAISCIYLISLSIYKKDWKNILITIAVIGFIFLMKYFDNNSFTKNSIEGKVTKVMDRSFILSEGYDKYYVNHENSLPINVGDILKVNGKFSIIEEGSFKIYAESLGTNVSGKAKNIEILRESRFSIRNNFYNNIMLDEGYYGIVGSVLLYGIPSNENSQILEETISTLGISHLIIISGFHISLLMMFIDKILSIFKIREWIKFTIGSLLGILFCWMTFMPPTALRAWSFKNVNKLNKKFFWNLNEQNTLALIALLFIVINPPKMLTIGMTLSFGITFLIQMITSMKINKYYKSLMIAMAAFVFATPFTTTFDGEFNISSPLISLLMTFPTAILYGSILILLPFKFAWPIIEPICWLFITMIDTCSYIVYSITITESILWVSFIFSSFNIITTHILRRHPISLSGIYCLSMFAIAVV